MSDPGRGLKSEPDPNMGLRQTARAAFAAVVAGTAVYSLWGDDFWFPIYTGRGYKLANIHFHGLSNWVMSAAWLALALAIVIWMVKQAQTSPGGKVDMRLVNVMAIAAGVVMFVMGALGVFGFAS
ncbi:hypothetical protein [Aestuariivirga litoralis]|uniref:hypothetical protein n=1 Tax=Aestuariivirga litoralis TaxID=2650924 RepID=UPI0018C68F31|nr:hypothetical protein [Aestuariivirga litoralis]MBG1233694.1 hypothetical protein [Aestuariivirga litoralis]